MGMKTVLITWNPWKGLGDLKGFTVHSWEHAGIDWKAKVLKYFSSLPSLEVTTDNSVIQNSFTHTHLHVCT